MPLRRSNCSTSARRSGALVTTSVAMERDLTGFGLQASGFGPRQTSDQSGPEPLGPEARSLKPISSAQNRLDRTHGFVVVADEEVRPARADRLGNVFDAVVGRNDHHAIEGRDVVRRAVSDVAVEQQDRTGGALRAHETMTA